MTSFSRRSQVGFVVMCLLTWLLPLVIHTVLSLVSSFQEAMLQTLIIIARSLAALASRYNFERKWKWSVRLKRSVVHRLRLSVTYMKQYLSGIERTFLPGCPVRWCHLPGLALFPYLTHKRECLGVTLGVLD